MKIKDSLHNASEFSVMLFIISLVTALLMFSVAIYMMQGADYIRFSFAEAFCSIGARILIGGTIVAAANDFVKALGKRKDN